MLQQHRMPLFGRSSSPEITTPPQQEQPSRNRSIFSRRSHSPEHTPSTTSAANLNGSTRSGHSGGFFSRRRSPSSSSDDLRNDPSILNARQKVTDADAAEREADRALMQARASVHGAREQVRLLEQEAREE